MSLDDLYRQDILDHSQNPRNFGTLEHPEISAEDSNPLCGDKIRMDLRVKDGTIEDVKFTGVGCSISRAAASMLTEEIKGKTLEEVKPQIEDQLKWERAQAEAERTANDAAPQLKKPADLDTVAKPRGMVVSESNFFARDEPISGLGMAPAVRAMRVAAPLCCTTEVVPVQVATPFLTLT